MNIKENLINIVGFFIVGMTNNFGYKIMISAAKDMMKGIAPASVVLLCNVLPSFLIATVFPIFQHKYKQHVFVIFATISCIAGFLLAGFSNVNIGLGLTGVILISFQQGIGESSMLSYSSFFGNSCLSAWSSGTGLAGLVGSFLYLLLTTILHIDYQLIIWSFSAIIFVYVVSFAIIKPQYTTEQKQDIFILNFSPKQKFNLLLQQWQIYVPLFLCYLFEYTVISGLNALLDYESNPGQFYTWAQCSSQLGVFLAKSSLQWFKVPYRINNLLFILEGVFMFIFLFEVIFGFIGSFWVMIVFVFLVGLVVGMNYGSSMYWLKQRENSKFLLSAGCMMMNAGIVCASGLGSLFEIILK